MQRCFNIRKSINLFYCIKGEKTHDCVSNCKKSFWFNIQYLHVIEKIWKLRKLQFDKDFESKVTFIGKNLDVATLMSGKDKNPSYKLLLNTILEALAKVIIQEKEIVKRIGREETTMVLQLIFLIG